MRMWIELILINLVALGGGGFFGWLIGAFLHPIAGAITILCYVVVINAVWLNVYFNG
jgi:hypothetical protein